MLQRIIIFVFSTTNSAITTGIVALLAACNSLKGKVLSIDDLLEQYAQVLKGIAKAKKDARLALAEITYTILKGAKAWALANGETELAAQWTTSLSALKRMKYSTLSQKVGNWITTVSPVITSLGDYNVTPAMITDWQSKNTDFNTLLNAPQQAIKDHKTLGKTINAAIDDAMELTIAQIDAIVATLMQQQPDYYNGYRTTREIIDPEHRHTAMDATVVNELGQPYYGVTVTVNEYTHTDETTGKTRTYKAVWGTTDINGKTWVNKFYAAPRTVTISGPGIVSQTFGPFPFVHGEIIRQTFTMQPSFDNLPASSTETPASWPEKVTTK
jgi:hypothetical protein